MRALLSQVAASNVGNRFFGFAAKRLYSSNRAPGIPRTQQGRSRLSRWPLISISIPCTQTLDAHEPQKRQVTCNDLSDSDSQFFAFIANGEFIATNSLPTTPDPSDWLDLVDQAAATIFTWKFGAALALGVLACCAAVCMYRNFSKGARHRSKVNKYRRDLTSGRGGNGRKVRSNSVRPQPYPGPVRHPGELHVAGSGRFQESWRRPGPGSIGGRSMRSMRSEQSARGVLLTGAGAVVPGQSSEGTRPSNPPHETCPECGLQLTDVVQLVKHVETQHGGRATRKKDAARGTPANAGGLRVAEAKAIDDDTYKSNAYSSMPIVTVAPSKKAAPPAKTGNPYADARAAAAFTAASTAAEAKPSSSQRTSTRSPEASTGGRSRHAGSGARQATAVATAAAAGVATVSRAKGRSPDGSRSRSPGTSGTGSGRSGSSSSSRPRSSSPAVAGSSPGRSGTSGTSVPSISSSSGGDRSSLPRIRDLSGHGRPGGKGAAAAAAAGSQESTSPLPRLLSHRRLGSGTPQRGSATAAARTGGATSRSASPNVSAGATTSSSGGSGSRSRAYQKPRGLSGDQGRPSGGVGRGYDRGGREQEPAPGFEQPRRGGVAKEDSVRSLTRTSSLDRMSALSSRAITRPTGYNNAEDESGGGGGTAAAAAATREAAERDEAARSRRRIGRNASTEDVVPPGQRLTADKLRVLGSGLPENFQLPPPVFSPVKPTAKEPAYSPVDRDRAGELDEDRPVSMTRKFFRQLSK